MNKQKSYMEYGQTCQKTGHKIGYNDCKKCPHFMDIATEEVPLCEGSIYTKTIGYVECKVSNNRAYYNEKNLAYVKMFESKESNHEKKN